MAAIKMADLLWQLKFHEGAAEMEKRFRNETGFEFSMKEKSTTHKNRDLMAERRVLCEGRFFNAVPHVKVRGGRNALRIYFAFDEERRRIVIGAVTEHLRTAGTRKRK